ncbi:hypothetical protein [Methanohalophilus portucalensis]|uniref:Uncharacterized protein n=3 Tax=Methanohalophilus portucalensis TaxID=39664 RepID=A0A1X7NAQ1_9EURY|nr:hypothetical protein [Methanohalophilus portucalensis]ATU08344.1 hypothetical protein BKM01_05895 [Methanohalophilus portucalensis]RNI13492.1 hypothetical protein EFE41_02625 [Methanohalophilus portucalensis FDF-1]SMH34691.1 hypothetical protein SAMN06264941_0879 [Methanohalophilus portucalensis FDF-1]
MNRKYGLAASSIDRIKEVPWEASLFFIGWIWLGWSMFGMTLANMYLSDPILDIYHLVVGVIYMLPMSVIGFKVFKSRNVAGLPLILCSCVIGVWAIILHSNLNLGFENELYFSQGIAVVMLILLLVAMPVSFYTYARSVGCDNTRNLKIILVFSAINGLVLVYNGLIGAFGIHSEIIGFLFFPFLLVIGPVLGGLYVWEVMSMNIGKDENKKEADA